MPPRRSLAAFSALACIGLYSAMAEEAAPGEWWSLRPLVQPDVPDGEGANPIDRFVGAKHAQLGLKASPEADRRTLIRRLYFDLWGLPPSPEEVAAFVADEDPDTYAKLVDKLLASPRYGERWARHWLDVVHYGETHGYDKDKPRPNAWPYRDYVIRAFNEDKPYARFIKEQLAGDVLWPGTVDGVVATGFIAAGPWDFIGHAEVPEEKIDGKVARHLDRDDMVTTTMNAFCSLTVQCAQCHDHKADPVVMKDYYALQSVFAALDRADRDFDPDPSVTRRRAELQAELSKLKPTKGGKRSDRYGYHSLVAKKQETTKWVQVDLGEQQTFDRVVLVGADEYGFADFGFPHRFRVEIAADESFTQPQVIADHTDADFPRPGRQAVTFEREGMEARFVRVTATKLWSRRKVGQPLSKDWIFALGELAVLSGDKLIPAKRVTSLDSIQAPPRWSRAALTDGVYGRQRLPKAGLEEWLAGAKPVGDGTRAAAIEAELASLPTSLKVYVGTVHKGSGTFKGRGHVGGKPRPIFVLDRGDVTSPGETEVKPAAVPGVVPGIPYQFELAADHKEGERRVALAEWIAHRDNTLTWRSIVNRVWQYHFGRGIVDTPNDFGRIGERPSHPELLDWLAVRFRDGGGSMKDLHRLILNSDTYKQGSGHHAGNAAIDGSNQFLWRQNRRRIEAEALRDTVLTVAGKMDLKMGGPSFRDFVIEKPQHSPHYQYHKHDPDDPASHRRSVYRFIVRSQPQPFMDTLDCADPSQLVDKRGETNTALQALALLNNKFMVRMAEHFAARVADEADPVAVAFGLALSRPPAPGELEDLQAYADDHGLAATCRLIFNLNEFAFVD